MFEDLYSFSSDLSPFCIGWAMVAIAAVSILARAWRAERVPRTTPGPDATRFGVDEPTSDREA